MPVTDPVSSISGRNSRASNVSVVTGASRSIRSHPAPNDTLSSAGVLSMLKTTTDTGDIGSLSFNNSRLPTMPRATHQKRGHHPKMSGSNHHYAPSQASRVSSSREWDSMSNQRRGSLTSMQSMPPSLPPVHLGKGGPMQMHPPPAEKARDSRSYSLTSAPQIQSLPRHRSAASLKSQGHEPRNGYPQSRPGPPPPMPENRPAYVYPTRLKRPGYRSPSPALSDTHSQPAPPPQGPPMGRRMPLPPRPPPPQSYNSDYGPEYGGDPRYLNVRQPPPRAMSNSPVMGYGEHAPPNGYPYRNPAAMRSAPGLGMHPPPPGHPNQHLHGAPMAQHPHGPPLQPPYARGYAPQPPMMHRPPYQGAPYPPRPGYPPYPGMQYAGHQPGPPPPPPNVAPMAHQMFHQAARMARQLPTRTDTPMTDGGVPSSDPPSSGTAPSGSSPPTPKDHSTIQVAVDPAFIDPAFINPALADLAESSSEPALAHQYLRYAEGLEKDVEDTEIEVAHPSIPASGFVQRVKAMLESKAAAEAAAQKEASDRDKFVVSHAQSQTIPQDEGIAVVDYEDEYELHELAANETPRFTLIEEYEAPVELPASPVRLAELPGDSPVQRNRRITRELVKAELRPSSADNTTSQLEVGETESIDGLLNSNDDQRQGEANGFGADTYNGAVEPEESSTPGKAAKRLPDDAGSDTTSSPVNLGLSGIDYAMRFDSEMTTDETQSKDPFVLDADTITLQHQRSREKVRLAEKSRAQDDHATLQRQPTTTAPVSPVLTGEEVSRCSAVSPLHTQTLGIDETVMATSEPAQDRDEDTSAGEPSVPGAYPEESQPPATPKTPKTYSKSVHLLPSTASTATDTPSSNRFSLPADLSTINDSTMNDSTDMITDVAVRFSLPQTQLLLVGLRSWRYRQAARLFKKPQHRSHREPQANSANAKRDANGTRSKRGSVTFADEIAPLKISKKQEQHLTSHKDHLDSQVNPPKSIVRRVSPLQESSMSLDSTSNLRFSNMINGINNRFGSTHLPGLKEESIEEMSISDKHKSDGTGGFQFPLPARIAAVKAMQERRLQESAEKAKARRARRHPNRPLAETRDLPSLNFSRMDLIDKLNEALEVRSSKSMEVIRRREFSGIYCPSPQRPQSTEPLRERYMSFFSKPEDFSTFFDDDDNDSDDEDEAGQKAIEDVKEHPEAVPMVEVQPSTEIDLDLAHQQSNNGSRPLSPEDFMDVASRVNRLSIPSVSGLSDRLSELLPNLRDLQLDSVLAGFGEATGRDLRSLSAADVRPGTVLSTRTSAGLLSLAERAEEIVKHGTHDSTVPIAQLLASGTKDLIALPDCVPAGKLPAILSPDGKQTALLASVSAPSELGQDAVARPASALALARQKSPTNEEEVYSMLPPEMNPIARNQKRAMIISSSSTRPWNQDENYPWSGTKVDIDLTVPSQAHVRKSMASEILRERRTKSLEITSNGEPTDTTKGIDIGSIYEKNPTASLTSEALTGISPSQHGNKSGKRSVIGSITKKITNLGPLGHRHDRSGCLGGDGAGNNTTRSIPTPTLSASGLASAGRSGSTLPHRPGERYPTSSLTPPALSAFNLDEVRSFFSDDSSEKERHGNASFRKRLTKLRSKKSVQSQGRPDPPSRRGHSLDNEDTTYDPGQLQLMGEDRHGTGAMSSAHTIDGVGMGKAEFRIKRFGEKLRNLMAKGGEIIRSFSQRSKPPARTGNERVRDDWLSDSLYSGV